MRYLYLHGFASSPQSAKAKFLRDRFRSRQLTLELPDLNAPSFFDLTVSRQIEQVEAIVGQQQEPMTIIGSSLGGLTAAWVAQRQPLIQALILLAPAFEFPNYWQTILGEETLECWQAQGSLPVFHYGYQQEMLLSYRFWIDCQRYREQGLVRAVPTTIIHGLRDDVIPIQASQMYARDRPWVSLMQVDSDHSLGSAVSEIWQISQQILKLPSANVHKRT